MKQIKEVAYIHDLGLTKTLERKTLKEHLLFRSANLGDINERGIEQLVNYNVKHVFDLRTDDEILYKPEDFISPKIEYIHLPLVPNDLNPAVTKENRVQVLNDLCALPGGMRAHILELYRYLIDNDMSKAGFKEIFKALLNNEKEEGYLFHCTQGKDRTGIAVYLILSALGVSEETILKIYLSFNNRARFKRVAYFLGMNIRFLSLTKAIALNDTLTARKAYFREFTGVINNKYGGVLNYLRTEVGLSDNDLIRLRQIYLQ